MLAVRADRDLFRRSVTLRRVDGATVGGSVEDDFHHFALVVTHRAGVVTAVAVDTIRAPWSTCPAAALPLQALTGRPLIARASDIGTLLPMRQQCTHMFDLAGLLLAFAGGDADALRYDAFVAGSGARRTATLRQNGATMLKWGIDGDTIARSGTSLGRGFREWTDGLPVPDAERAFVLRRAVFVAGGRSERLEEWKRPDDLALPVGVCFSLGAEVRRDAIRTPGTRVDFAAVAAGRTS